MGMVAARRQKGKTATRPQSSGSGLSLVSRGTLSRATGGLEGCVGEPRQSSPESERRGAEPSRNRVGDGIESLPGVRGRAFPGIWSGTIHV